MYCILTVGMTGQGKSEFTKAYIKGRNCLVFDVQNEYLDLSTNNIADRSRTVDLNIKRFFDLVKSKMNTVCVFEEATVFFEGKMEKDLRFTVVRKRHSKNIFIFCFHSIAAIPPRLLTLTNFVVLYKTGDERRIVEEKSTRLLPYWDKVMKSPPHSCEIIKLIEQ